MKITFPCRYCASSLQAEAALAGMEVFCAVCRSTTRVPEARLGPGVILGGFRIRRLLGTGLQSQVYLARQLSMGRDAALKIFLPAPGQPAEETAAVARARKAARLDHPHLPTIYEIGRDGAYRFVAEAFIPGEDLGRRLRRGRIPAAQALVWIG